MIPGERAPTSPPGDETRRSIKQALPTVELLARTLPRLFVIAERNVGAGRVGPPLDHRGIDDAGPPQHLAGPVERGLRHLPPASREREQAARWCTNDIVHALAS
jgi:hypothetical protein